MNPLIKNNTNNYNEQLILIVNLLTKNRFSVFIFFGYLNDP